MYRIVLSRLTATDIGGPILTAQLSNAAGSFTSPINIGTLSGNASIAVIDGFLLMRLLAQDTG
jgi:hypothetical protein